MSRVSSAHGSRSRYLAGCRCTGCKAANSEYIKAWRTTRTDAQRRHAKAQERLRETARRIVARRHRREYLQVLADLRAELEETG